MRLNLEERISALELEDAKRRASLEQAAGIDLTDHIAPVYLPLHADIEAQAHTVYNLPGGRGSCKSSFVSLEIVNGIMKDPTGNSSAIVFRLVAGTMRESVFNQIAWAIDTLGVNHLWKSRFSPMSYTYTPTGAQIVFRGLDDASKLKSIKPAKGVFRYVWFEEFSELPGPNFLRNVMQSVQRGGDSFVVFRSFNPPISRNNWANIFIAEPDERAITLLTNYTMIPPAWLGDSFIYEAERLREVNPTAYRHEYMGEPTGTGGEVFPNVEVREITDQEINGLGYIYQGLDFGFAADPAAFVRVAYERKTDTIYFLDEIYKRGMSNRQLAESIKEKGYDLTGQAGVYLPITGEYTGPRRALVTCDCAEPKSISDLCDYGIKAIGCHKEPGCVEYRTKWLQHRRIVIDPARTPNAHREFVAYSYETDKDGNILARLPDKDNHTIDASAYALDTLIYYKRGLSA